MPPQARGDHGPYGVAGSPKSVDFVVRTFNFPKCVTFCLAQTVFVYERDKPFGAATVDTAASGCSLRRTALRRVPVPAGRFWPVAIVPLAWTDWFQAMLSVSENRNGGDN